MTAKITDKYIRTNHTHRSRHSEVTAPIPMLKSDDEFGGMGFHMYWKCVTQPYTDEYKTHCHDFDQYLVFLSGDPTNMLDLGGEVELTLSEDGKHFQTHVFTSYTSVYVTAGLYHCPLIFKKVTKPIIFYDYISTYNYSRKEEILAS